MANDYFQERGLVQLDPVRDDVSPGTLVYVEGLNPPLGFLPAFLDKNRMILGFHARNYAEAEYPLPLEPTVNAAFPEFQHTMNLDASIALTLLDTLFPGNVHGELALTGSVNISQFLSRVQRPREMADLGALLSDASVKKHNKQMRDKDRRPYVVLETHEVKSVTIESAVGMAIGVSIEVGNVKELLEEGKLKVKVKRNTETSLTLAGEEPFVVAVKAYEVEDGNWDAGKGLELKSKGRTLHR